MNWYKKAQEELPPYEELLPTYDLEMCKEMLKCIKADIANSRKKPSSLQIRFIQNLGEDPEEYMADKQDALLDILEATQQRINELAGV